MHSIMQAVARVPKARGVDSLVPRFSEMTDVRLPGAAHLAPRTKSAGADRHR